MVEATSLKGTYLVSGLGEDAMAQIAAISQVQTYSSGRCLIQIGDPADKFFVILSGRIRVTTSDGDELGQIGEGSILGEMGLVDAQNSTANATCVGHVSAIVIPIPEMRQLMNQNRAWGFVVLANISRVMSDRLRKTNARVDLLSDHVGDLWDNAL